MSYVLLAPGVVWGCVPAVAASEIQYVAMTTDGLSFIDVDPNNEYRKRIAISRDDTEVALVWCTWVAAGASVEFLIDGEARADDRAAAHTFREAALRRARAQRWMRDMPGFRRSDRS